MIPHGFSIPLVFSHFLFTEVSNLPYSIYYTNGFSHSVVHYRAYAD